MALLMVLRFSLLILLVRRIRSRWNSVYKTSTEFIISFAEFFGELKGKSDQYKQGFNNSRFHKGVKAHPAKLYNCNVRKLP